MKSVDLMESGIAASGNNGAPLLQPLRVRVLGSPGELRSLSAAWNAMVRADRMTPMQEAGWYLSGVEALLRDSKPMCVAVEDIGTLRAVAPLMQSAAFPRCYEQVGAMLGEPCSLLYADEPALHALLGALSRTGHALKLDRLGDDPAALAAIRRCFAGKALIIIRPGSKLPYLPLQDCGEDVESLLSPRLIRDLRRARRKALGMGAMTFDIHSPASAEDFHPLFEEALRVEAAGWKGRAGTALADDPVRCDFFRRYGLHAAESKILRLAFMRIDSRPVAMQFAIQTGERYWLLKIGYDEAYGKCSPGQLLLFETLAFAGRRNLVSYEFLGSSERWTQRWTSLERSSHQVHVYPFTLNGIFALAQESSKRVWAGVRGKPRQRA